MPGNVCAFDKFCHGPVPWNTVIGGPGGVDDALHETGLADAGLALDEDDRGPPEPELVDRFGRALQLGVAPDQPVWCHDHRLADLTSGRQRTNVVATAAGSRRRFDAPFWVSEERRTLTVVAAPVRSERN